MPKLTPSFDPDGYSPVADRIALFYETYPDGRIVTELVSRTEHEVVFRALVFRHADDVHPAATGWAAEREGDGDVNAVACLENTETSAIGRALANLGFTASRQRPSAEEMAKASRARARLARHETREAARIRPPASIDGPTMPPLQAVREPAPAPTRAVERRDTHSSLSRRPPPATETRIVEDLLELVARAERAGLRAARAERWQRWLRTRPYSVRDLALWEQRLRGWVARQGRPPAAGRAMSRGSP